MNNAHETWLMLMILEECHHGGSLVVNVGCGSLRVRSA